MRTIAKLGSIAAAVTLLSTFVLAAPKSERTNKHFNVAGTVLQIDLAERTLLVRDRYSKKLYLIEIPEAVTFKITFGRYMRMSEPGFGDVFVNEWVNVRCRRIDKDHLAKLADGQVAVRSIAIG